MEVLVILASLVVLSLGATTTNSHALAEFAAKGITVYSSGNCHDKHKPNCTSFDGLQLVSFSGILNFAKKSGCPITIIHGTEVGHTSGVYTHGNGYKLDISDTSCVNSYVAHYKHTGTNPDGVAVYEDPKGNVFAHESQLHHWDTTWYHYTE